MKLFPFALALLCTIYAITYAYPSSDQSSRGPEKNVLHASPSNRQNVKTLQDEKNIISGDEHDEDNLVKSGENNLNDDAFDFSLHPDPDEAHNI